MYIVVHRSVISCLITDISQSVGTALNSMTADHYHSKKLNLTEGESLEISTPSNFVQ